MGDGAIPWKTKKQSSVALSPVEAEYIAMCQGAKEIASIAKLYRQLYENIKVEWVTEQAQEPTAGTWLLLRILLTKPVIYKSPCGAELQAREHMAFEYQTHEEHWNIIDEGAPDHQLARLFGNRGPGRV